MDSGRNILTSFPANGSYSTLAFRKGFKEAVSRIFFKQWKPSADGVKHLNKLFKT